MNYTIEVLIPQELATGEPGDDHGPEVNRMIGALTAAGFIFIDYGALVSTDTGEKQELVFDYEEKPKPPTHDSGMYPGLR